MAMTFPSNPTTGQQYSVSGGPTYTWDGTVWKILTPGSQFSEQQFTATAGQTSFTVSGGYVIGAVDVYRNGVKLVVGVDFLATDLSTVVLTNAAAAGDTIEVVKAAQILYADALKSTNNLSDVGNAATALSNLGGLPKAGGSMTGALDLRHASGVSSSYDAAEFILDAAASNKYCDLDFKHGGVHKWRVGTNGGDGLVIFRPGSGGYVIVDTSGRVTMPSQTAFKAYGSAGNVTLTYGGINKLDSLTNTALNRGSCYSTTNRRFTAPVSGVYLLSACVTISGNSVSSPYNGLYFYVNGGIATGEVTYAPKPASQYCSISRSTVISLNANDYVELYYDVSASGVVLEPDRSIFVGHLIG